MPHESDPEMLLLRGNTLLAAGRPADAIIAYRAGIALRPAHVPTLYNLGNAHLALDDAAAAEACYAAALALAPDHAGSQNNRGQALRRLGRLEEAVTCLRATVALRPDLAGAHDNLGAALLAMHRPAPAEATLREAIRLRPDYAEACNNLGGALLALDRPEEALLWFRRAVALDAAVPQARLGIAMCLLSLGRLRDGFAAYEARWLDPKFREDVRAYAAPRWNGAGSLRGKTILLHHEQGLGDTLQFARYAPLLRARGACVVLEVQKPLVRLLRPLAETVVAAGGDLPPHDVRLPLLSLPHAFGTALQTIPAAVPYLLADAPEPAVRGPGLNVAITLRGSPDHPEDVLRSIPPAAFLPVLRAPGVTFHLLHAQPRDDDRVLVGSRQGYGPALENFADTAALLRAMDLVITVDTAMAHLAGALGRPVWIALQHAADFRWLRGRDDTRWYPTARLFRQGPERRWEPVLDRIAAALAELTPTRHPR